MNNEDYEKIINNVYPGLTHYVRDMNLDEELINKYKVNDIILEKAFTDCTSLISGLTKNVRYSIFSNNAHYIGELKDSKAPLVHVLDRDSVFKVLDVYKKDNKTLITLLHIPFEYINIFKKISNNLDEMVIKQARKRFEDCLNGDVVNELDDEWYKRISFPLGMTEDGKMFPLEKQEI